MLSETRSLSLALQTPGLFKALRVSYGIRPSATAAARARALAPSVTEFRPGVYHVGACIVDLWAMACSCSEQRQARRAGKSHTCPHFLALYLVGAWSPCDPNPTAALARMGVARPRILAIYCRVRLPRWETNSPHTFRVVAIQDDAADVQAISTGKICTAHIDRLNHLFPFYE